jgi:tetratricopeptide (TPR) repeat protein
LIHYKQSRYSAALCVLNHALELIHFSHGCLTLEDSLPLLDPTTTLPLLFVVADLLASQARVHRSMGHLRLAKRTVKQALQLLAPRPAHHHFHSHSHWHVLFAKALVVLSSLYNEDKPNVAMQHHQQALAMLRYSLGDNHVHVAETITHIGNLHTSQGLYHLARDSFGTMEL